MNTILKRAIQPEMIALQASAADWRDAVRQGGQLLLKGGCIRPEYIDAMVQVIEEVGPYVVISKHIALPHARPEEGVCKMGISVLTLATPVNFGNEENDPVKYVFCLAAGDSSQHLEMLQGFVGLLERKEFFALLDSASDPKEVAKFIADSSPGN